MATNEVWVETTLPTNSKAIPTKWVFKVKAHPDGSVERFKARLTAKGCNYNLTYSPVLLLLSLRLFLTIAAHLACTVHMVDIDTAFLIADLTDVDVYIKFPDEYTKHTENTNCLKLKKFLYGLKQSNMVWYNTLSEFLKGKGFTSLASKPCIFVRNNEDYISCFVDDICYFSTKDSNAIEKTLSNQYKLKVLGPLSFLLGMK
eukprot:Awhi_evm2s4690